MATYDQPASGNIFHTKEDPTTHHIFKVKIKDELGNEYWTDEFQCCYHYTTINQGTGNINVHLFPFSKDGSSLHDPGSYKIERKSGLTGSWVHMTTISTSTWTDTDPCSNPIYRVSYLGTDNSEPDRSTPADPGDIEGQDSLDVGEYSNYSTPEHYEADSYEWDSDAEPDDYHDPNGRFCEVGTDSSNEEDRSIDVKVRVKKGNKYSIWVTKSIDVINQQ